MGPTALFDTVGPKGSRGFGPFHIKPKAHAEEEVPDDEWKESKLSEYTAEDGLVLGRPKSQKGKDPKGDSKPNGLAIGAW